MSYNIPQFINIETKILGPLTFKQAIYVIGSVAILILCIFIFGGVLGFIVSIPFIVTGLILSFIKYNSRPFVHLLESGVKYYFTPKKYVWKKEKVNRNTILLERMREKKSYTPIRKASVDLTLFK